MPLSQTSQPRPQAPSVGFSQSWDALMEGSEDLRPRVDRDAVELAMVEYMEREAAQHDTWWYAVARCMLGLRHGQRGARRWRQVWSDHRLKSEPAREVYRLAQQALAADQLPVSGT